LGEEGTKMEVALGAKDDPPLEPRASAMAAGREMLDLGFGGRGIDDRGGVEGRLTSGSGDGDVVVVAWWGDFSFLPSEENLDKSISKSSYILDELARRRNFLSKLGSNRLCILLG
jgi:hypothetical protein